MSGKLGVKAGWSGLVSQHFVMKPFIVGLHISSSRVVTIHDGRRLSKPGPDSGKRLHVTGIASCSGTHRDAQLAVCMAGSVCSAHNIPSHQ